MKDSIKQRIEQVRQGLLAQGIPAESITVKERILYDTRIWRGNESNFAMDFFQIARGNSENVIAATDSNRTSFLKTDAHSNNETGGKTQANQHLILSGYRFMPITDKYSRLKTLISDSEGVFAFKIGDEMVIETTPLDEIIPYPDLVVKTGQTATSAWANEEFMVPKNNYFHELMIPFEIKPGQTFLPSVNLKKSKTDEANASDAMRIRLSLKVIEIKAKNRS